MTDPSSSIFSFTFDLRRSCSDPADIWWALHKAYVSCLMDPISVYIDDGGDGAHGVLPGSPPMSEEYPRFPGEVLIPELRLTKLRDRSGYLDLSSPTSAIHEQIIQRLRFRGAAVELWGPVRILAPRGDFMMEDWFLMEEFPVEFPFGERTMRYEILRIEIRLEPDELSLRLNSLTNVWSDVAFADAPTERWSYPRKKGRCLEAAEANVQSLFGCTRQFLDQIKCRKLVWSELLDGERPDRCSLMRPVITSVYGPQSNDL